jgi:hypothetical protein
VPRLAKLTHPRTATHWPVHIHAHSPFILCTAQSDGSDRPAGASLQGQGSEGQIHYPCCYSASVIYKWRQGTLTAVYSHPPRTRVGLHTVTVRMLPKQSLSGYTREASLSLQHAVQINRHTYRGTLERGNTCFYSAKRLLSSRILPKNVNTEMYETVLLLISLG